MANFDNTPAEPVALVHQPWAPVLAVLTNPGTDPTTIAGGDFVDGVELADDDRFLCAGTRSDAGIYVASPGGASSAERAEDADSPADFLLGRTVRVLGGSAAGIWRFNTEGPVALDVTNLSFAAVRAEPVALAAEAAHSNTPPGSVVH